MSTDHEPPEAPYEPPVLRVLGDVHVLTEGPFGNANPDANFFHASNQLGARSVALGDVVNDVLRLRRDAVEWKEIEGEIVALEAETSTYLAANPSGALVWQALAAGATREQLVERFVAKYGIMPEAARGDIDAFLSELSARGLLEDP